jgi:hypothetical protein
VAIDMMQAGVAPFAGAGAMGGGGYGGYGGCPGAGAAGQVDPQGIFGSALGSMLGGAGGRAIGRLFGRPGLGRDIGQTVGGIGGGFLPLGAQPGPAPYGAGAGGGYVDPQGWFDWVRRGVRAAQGVGLLEAEPPMAPYAAGGQIDPQSIVGNPYGGRQWWPQPQWPYRRPLMAGPYQGA